MKYTEFLVAHGDNMEHALSLIKQEMNEKYADKSCKLNNLIVLPEARASATLGVTGMQNLKMSVTLVAVIDEEPEIEMLQRNYKMIFDYLNSNVESFLPVILGWLAAVSDTIPADKKDEFLKRLNALEQKPFNE